MEINMKTEILMINMLGCSKAIPFNIDIQQVDNVDNIISVAETHSLAMFQGLNGYVEVWHDDSNNYCCQASIFDTEKKGSSINAIVAVDENSLQIGDKKSAVAWLKNLERWLTEETNIASKE
jgi:hypothetical protein